jgi:hypothetical protein
MVAMKATVVSTSGPSEAARAFVAGASKEGQGDFFLKDCCSSLVMYGHSPFQWPTLPQA